jgi:hypothetical protein
MTNRAMTGWGVFLFILLFSAPMAAQEDAASPSAEAPNLPGSMPILPVAPPIVPVDDSNPQGIQWRHLFNQSLRLLLIEHGFRYATEEDTRHPHRPFFQGYIDSVGAMHGWADGDPFYVNYVGHPMQGAVSGYLWTFNDTRYSGVEFGKNPEYWKSRLRAGAFAWAYSEQMEIGPISEASIGNIQSLWPQEGLVDHVVTPAIGLGWMIAEDALDRYLVRFVERKTQNRTVRALVRGGANPSRSFANVISGKWPWFRERDHGGDVAVLKRPSRHEPYSVERAPGVAPFEFAANAYGFAAPSGICAGGGATAAFRVSSEWQMVLDVNGCKMTRLEQNLTGDSLTYMTGPRWTPPVTGELVPYFQVLFGGNKLTQELVLPNQEGRTLPDGRSSQRHQFERDGFAMAAGMGLDLNFNRALAFRLIGVEYTRSWTSDLNGYAAAHGFQLKTGLVLHMGTW